MATTHSASVSTRMVVGLVVTIAAVDVVANALAPEPARVPVKLGILVALVAWSRCRVGLGWDELGLGREHLGAGLRLGGIAAGIVAVVVTMAAVISPSYFESSDVTHASTTKHIVMVFVIIPLGTALFEETIFRGVLLGVLLRRWSQLTSVIVSSFLFGLWHLLPALSSDSNSGAAKVGSVIGTIAFTTAGGVVFAWLRLRSKSLAAPVLAHTATNSFTYLAAWFVPSA